MRSPPTVAVQVRHAAEGEDVQVRVAGWSSIRQSRAPRLLQLSGRNVPKRLRPNAPDVFARRAVDAVLRNQAVIVLPSWWKLRWCLERLSPSLSLRISEAMYDRLQAELAGAGARATEQPTASSTSGHGV